MKAAPVIPVTRSFVPAPEKAATARLAQPMEPTNIAPVSVPQPITKLATAPAKKETARLVPPTANMSSANARRQTNIRRHSAPTV